LHGIPEAPEQRAVALPPGRWVLIGAIPGEITGSVSRSHGGGFALCSFEAVWAIQVAGGPGAIVLCVQDQPTPPRLTKPHRLRDRRYSVLYQWASLVYNAAIRRPRVGFLNSSETPALLTETWGKYVKAARSIKRSIKRGHR
jgi:hypothetical protein